MSRGLFCLSLLAFAVADSVHQLPLVPRMSWSPRPLMMPWALPEPWVPMIAAFEPVTVMNGLQPLPVLAVVPQAAWPETW